LRRIRTTSVGLLTVVVVGRRLHEPVLLLLTLSSELPSLCCHRYRIKIVERAL